MKRREFVSAAAVYGAGTLILPRYAQAQKGANDKMNVALIGVWGRGEAHYGDLRRQNVVALCDVRESRFPKALEAFPGATTYTDWRKALDHKDLDAVVICTADHHHAFISNWALNRNLHIYCEKPLAITVNEARTVRANWLGKKGKIATQVGMQRHAIDNFNRVRELILDGAIGELQDAFAWGNRQIRRDGYYPAEGAPPADFHWDTWLGPSPEHPYNDKYFKGGAGANCLEWNMFWDFGAGQIGDMGSHTMDLLWNAVDATLPTSAEAKGDPFNPDVTPVMCESHFEHPKNDWRGPIRTHWYQGGAMPGSPKGYIDLKQIDHGAMFKGTKGHLIAGFDSRILSPLSDLSYYKARPADKLLPPLGSFFGQWVDACKDPTKKTACDFEYSGNMIEQMLLGLVAYRAGKKIEYDGATGKITNDDAANAFLTKPYRAGWTING